MVGGRGRGTWGGTSVRERGPQCATQTECSHVHRSRVQPLIELQRETGAHVPFPHALGTRAFSTCPWHTCLLHVPLAHVPPPRAVHVEKARVPRAHGLLTGPTLATRSQSPCILNNNTHTCQPFLPACLRPPCTGPPHPVRPFTSPLPKHKLPTSVKSKNICGSMMVSW